MLLLPWWTIDEVPYIAAPRISSSRPHEVLDSRRPRGEVRGREEVSDVIDNLWSLISCRYTDMPTMAYITPVCFYSFFLATITFDYWLATVCDYLWYQLPVVIDSRADIFLTKSGTLPFPIPYLPMATVILNYRLFSGTTRDTIGRSEWPLVCPSSLPFGCSWNQRRWTRESAESPERTISIRVR